MSSQNPTLSAGALSSLPLPTDGAPVYTLGVELDDTPRLVKVPYSGVVAGEQVGPSTKAAVRDIMGINHLVARNPFGAPEAPASVAAFATVPLATGWSVVDKHASGTASITYAGADRLDMAYNFPTNATGSEYLIITRNLGALSTASDKYITFDLRTSVIEKLGLQVRVVDNGGQTLTKGAVRLTNLCGQTDSDWIPCIANITKATSYSGGANNGTTVFPISQIQLIFQPKYVYGEQPSGALSIRNLRLVSNTEQLIEAMGAATDLYAWTLGASTGIGATAAYDGTKNAAKVAWTAGAAGTSASLTRGVMKFPWLRGIRADISTPDQTTEVFIDYTDTRGNVFSQKVKDANALTGTANDTLVTCYAHLGGAGELVASGNAGVFSGVVQSIRFRFATASTTGQVFIANVYALDVVTRSTIELSTAPVVTTTQTLELAETVGINYNVGQNFGNHWHEVARGTGACWIRRELKWSSIETSAGVYNFGGLLTEKALLDQLGFKIVYMLNGGNTLYTASTAALPTTAPHRTAFAAFAAAAVAALGVSNIMYEIVNEFDLNTYGADPALYGQLMDVTIAAMKAANPAVKLMNSAASQHFDSKQDATRLLLAASINKPNVFAFHWYNWGTTNSAAATGKLENERFPVPENACVQAIWHREQADQLQAQMVVSEWGYSAYDLGGGDGSTQYGRRQQAVCFVRQVLGAWVAGAAVQIVYTLGDTGTGSSREHCFGLVDYSGVAKPAFTAFNALMNMTRGRKLLGAYARTNDNPNFTGVSLEGMDIVWASSLTPDMVVSVTTSKAVKAFDMFGNELPLVRRGKVASISMRFIDGPVYLLNE